MQVSAPPSASERSTADKWTEQFGSEEFAHVSIVQSQSLGWPDGQSCNGGKDNVTEDINRLYCINT